MKRKAWRIINVLGLIVLLAMKHAANGAAGRLFRLSLWADWHIDACGAKSFSSMTEWLDFVEQSS